MGGEKMTIKGAGLKKDLDLSRSSQDLNLSDSPKDLDFSKPHKEDINSSQIQKRSYKKKAPMEESMVNKVQELWDLVRLRLDVDDLSQMNDDSINVRELLLKLKQIKEKSKKDPLTPIRVKELRQMVAMLREKVKKKEEKLKEKKAKNARVKEQPKVQPQIVNATTDENIRTSLRELLAAKKPTTKHLSETKLIPKARKKKLPKPQTVPTKKQEAPNEDLEHLIGVQFYKPKKSQTKPGIKNKFRSGTRKTTNIVKKTVKPITK